MKTCYIYARTATTTQKEEYKGISKAISQQVNACTTYAKENGYKVLNTFTEVAPGNKFKRQSLQLLLDECKKKSVDTVIILRVDRLSRNASDYFKILIQFNKLGIQLISVQDGQLNKGIGMFTGSILASVAQYELERSEAK